MWGTDATATVTLADGQVSRPSSASRKATGASNGSSAPSRNSCCGCGTFTDVEDLQQALRTFKETYNQQWLIERLGFRAPAVVRRAFALTTGRVNTLTRLSKKSVERYQIKPTHIQIVRIK